MLCTACPCGLQHYASGQLLLVTRNVIPRWKRCGVVSRNTYCKTTHQPVLRQCGCHRLPDAAGAGLQLGTQHRVGAPPCVLLAVQRVRDCAHDVHCCHTLAQSVALHARWPDCPYLQAAEHQTHLVLCMQAQLLDMPATGVRSHCYCLSAHASSSCSLTTCAQVLGVALQNDHLEGVWPHEQIGNALAHDVQNPLVKVIRLCVGCCISYLCILWPVRHLICATTVLRVSLT
jgi:hypothetical protein